MLRDDPQRSHRITVAAVRHMIYVASSEASLANSATLLSQAKEDLEIINKAADAYIRANTHWQTFDNDENMIDLIGTWARMTKVIRDMDDKYGSRR